MTHREILEALSGLLLGLLVAILSSTIVTTALPQIVPDLGGSQTSFTWIVTATLLAMTVSVPIWGKLADLTDRKALVQTALVIYTVGSILAGLSQSVGWLIGARLIQGIGVGGLMSLTQVILSDLVSPRERGRYMGYLGATMAIGTVCGPLLGGVITDSALGWRGCFFVGLPIALAALLVLQTRLHLPAQAKRRVHIDVPGALLLSAGVSLLLIWVSFAGDSFDWASWQTAVMVPGSLLLVAAAVFAERRAPEPLVPLEMFANRTIVLAVIASGAVGVALFGTSVFLSQYMQLSRGYSPTASGLLTMPMAIGILVSSTLIGRRISRTGNYKPWMITGTVMLAVGLALMGTLDETTNLFELGGFMAIIGLGVGMTMQNLVLVVQNTVPRNRTGAASSLVAFTRTLFGTLGVAGLGAALAAKVSTSITSGLAEAGINAPAGGSGSVPQLDTLPDPVRQIVEHAYGVGTAGIFLIAAPLALIAILAVSLLPRVELGTKSGIDELREKERAELMAEPTMPPTSAPADHHVRPVAAAPR
ncbi:MFS transporter [Thermoleophilia bacterium SCSIO 60948]|nr:MFS transporter [Thermoleophilia bacterium SCSIO 60948]